VENFGSLAKYSAFSGAIIVNFILYGLFVLLITRIQNKFPWKGYVGRAILSSLVAYTILLIIAISLVTITEVRSHGLRFILSSFYANVRLSLKKPVLDKKPETTSEIDYSKRVSRRVFLRAAIATIIALPILYLGLNRLFLQHEVQVPGPFLFSLIVT
jgi:hypothetical protein